MQNILQWCLEFFVVNTLLGFIDQSVNDLLFSECISFNSFNFTQFPQTKRVGDDHGDSPEKCTICLSEYEEGEDVR